MSVDDFENTIEGTDGDQFAVHTTQLLGLGQEMRFIDGRRFRYARAGAVAVVPGKLYQAPIPIADHVLRTPVAAAVGDRVVGLALGATATTADQYRDGYVVVDLSTNTGFGYMYQVNAHPVIDASSTFQVPLRSPVQVAIATTATSASLVANNYAGVILTIATTPTAVLTGCSVKAIPIGQYGWIQVAGNVPCLVAGTNIIGCTCWPSGTAGAQKPSAATVVMLVPIVGNVVRVATTTNYSTINLCNLE
jgi:hypothetical protein